MNIFYILKVLKVISPKIEKMQNSRDYQHDQPSNNVIINLSKSSSVDECRGFVDYFSF